MNPLRQLLAPVRAYPSPGRTLRLVVPLFCASLLFMAPLLFAPASVAEGWQPLGLRGQTVLDLAVATSDGRQIIYAETATGLWRYMAGSAEQAAEWRSIDAGLPRNGLGGPALAAWSVTPGNPRQLYAVTGAGDLRQLYRSLDAGESWQSVGPAPGQTARPALAVVAGPHADADLIALATSTRIQRSTDGGGTWSPGGPWPGAPDDAAAGGQDDGVATLLAHGSAGESLFALTHGKRLWQGDSGGVTWRAIEPAGNSVTALAMASHPGARVWAATDAGLAASDDGGASWSLAPLPGREAQGPNPNRLIDALAPDPRVAGTVYASLRGGTVYRSDDDGATWTLLGAPGATRVTALALDAATRNALYAATEDGVWVRGVVAFQPTATPVSSDTPSPVPTETSTLAPTASATATETPTITPMPTATLTATDTAVPTATASATATRRPTRGPTRTPSPTLTRAVTPSAAPPGTSSPAGGGEGAIAPLPPAVPAPRASPTPVPPR